MTGGRRARRRRGPVGGRWLTAVLVAVAANRAVRPERQAQLIGAQGVAVWLLAPALPAAAFALRRGRWSMAATDLLLVGAQLRWIVRATAGRGPQAAPPGAVPLRLVTANVLLDNPAVDRLAAELLRSDAEVIVLQEITPENLAVLERSPLWTAYPGRVADPSPGFHGSLILSRLPIDGGGVVDVAGFPMTQADVVTAAGVVRILDVHTIAPVNRGNTRHWRGQLAALAAMTAPPGSALVMAGDFNATADHAPFQRVLTAGRRDAFLEAGRGFGATWPQWRGPMVPVMRLDHVIVDDAAAAMSVHVVALRVEANPGSDHRRLVADLALVPRR